MPISAKQREREAVAELREAARLVYLSSLKFRNGTTATLLTGQLQAAIMIIEDVADDIDGRTSEN